MTNIGHCPANNSYVSISITSTHAFTPQRIDS